MKSRTTLALLGVFLPFLASAQHLAQGGPKKVYGVNLGGLFVSEPWLNPQEWLNMGGEDCEDCSACRRDEFALTKYLGQKKADQVFAQVDDLSSEFCPCSHA